MNTRWDEVRAWRERLRKSDTRPHRGSLSVEGMAEIWSAALDAIDDGALTEVSGMRGEPFSTAAMALARTVPTAPIEWCAVLLGRGTRLVLKVPASDPGAVPLLVDAAEAVDLPLIQSSDRAGLDGAEIIIAMGSDRSVREIEIAHPGARTLAFGHRFSAAFVTREDSFAALAYDAALHDGRGCMSPVLAVTTLPLSLATDALASAMEQAQVRWPRGEISPEEAAMLRTAEVIARASGRLRRGVGWSVRGITADRFRPSAMPRSVALVSLPEGEDALWQLLRPWIGQISTIGADTTLVAPSPAIRIAALGTMQRPPLIRRHDGIDWLEATLKGS